MIEPVVSIEQLRMMGDRVVPADVRWYLDGRSGRAAYQAGHLPGAVFVDLDRVLARPGSPAEGRHPLPHPAAFAEAMGALGVSDGDIVIAYDDAGGVIASRLVWMLRATGHEAALLDGGLAAYPGKLETAEVTRPLAVFTPRVWPDALLADMKDAADESAVVLDAREPARFRGETEPVDPRAGHIPGARSVPCRDNVDADGRFLPVPALRKRFEAAGVTEGSPVISYCGSGVTACHNLIALEHAGFPAGRLYPGSWSQWSSDPDRPVAVGV